MAPTTKKVKEKDEHKCPHCSKVLIDRSSYLLHQKLHTDQYPFSCSICPYKCKIKKYLARHVKKTHNQANGPDCPVCGKVFHFLSNLKNHMRVHTGEKPFKCQVCGKAFSSTYCLSMHKLIHTDEKPFQCSFCDYACRDSSTLRKHQERHMGIYKTYPCEKCKKIFKTSTSLRLHIDEVHYGLNTRTFGCDKCDKAFKTKATLRIHVKAIHDKSLRTECEICGQNISKSSVGNHLNTHVDIRPFKCSFKHCGKKFKERGSLKKHTLIHYPEHQYQCDLCDCRFPRKSRLRDHKLRHTASGGYTCDYCGVSFTSKRYLLTHIKKIHSENSEKFICDECGLINYSKRAIILHLRYGHGSEHDRKCQICSGILKNSKVLTDHYWKTHNVRFVVQKKKGDEIVIKDEPIEVLAEFDFDYDVQKIEVDEYIPDPQYADTETTLAYSEKVLAEDISRSIGKNDSAQHPESRFDEIYMEHVVDKAGVEVHIPDPEYVETETTLSYSKSVLEEDISRSILERNNGHQAESEFDEFFVQVMNKPKKKDLPTEKVDKRKLKVMKKTIKKMLCDSKLRKETDNLEKIRRQYNSRIKSANKSSEKKEPKQIKYFNKSDNNAQNNINHDDQESEQDDENNDRPSLEETEENGHENDSSLQENDKLNQENDKLNQENDKLNQENDKLNQENDKLNQENDKLNQENDETNQENNIAHDTNNMEDENINDKTIAKRTRRQRRIKVGDSGENYSKDVYYGEAGDNGETNKNGKLTFIGHECYICFKLFKTKNDLKIHCKEHFDICNEKMLTKCPFCGFVTNRNIKRHIELVHKININYAYGQVTEKTNNNGSKYVFEIDKDCELEIIPSISNLNKIACMKFDEKNRQNKNVFMGKTKLVKKGSNWIIEKERVTVTNEHLLPEFSEDEYKSLKIDGDSYLDGIKMLSRLAKRKGLKMLYPCSDCEKICQTLSALKLHSRKHEANPKRFKPKVWVNRHIEYKTKNRKRIRCSNKTKNKIKEAAAVNKQIRRGPVKVIDKTDVILDNRKNKSIFDTENRFAAPKPVKNKHKCDKQLIEFYNSNIKGKDIEFWQFLKIFNKMSRENVNDFEDLENRNDAHFGVHIKEKSNEPVDTDTVPVAETVLVTKKVPVTEKIPVTENVLVVPKTTGKKNAKKPFTRAIMISKKEYMRRNEIKNQMRKKIEENK